MIDGDTHGLESEQQLHIWFQRDKESARDATKLPDGFCSLGSMNFDDTLFPSSGRLPFLVMNWYGLGKDAQYFVNSAVVGITPVTVPSPCPVQGQFMTEWQP